MTSLIASQKDFKNMLKRKVSNKILFDLTTHFFTESQLQSLMGMNAQVTL